MSDARRFYEPITVYGQPAVILWVEGYRVKVRTDDGRRFYVSRDDIVGRPVPDVGEVLQTALTAIDTFFEEGKQ